MKPQSKSFLEKAQDLLSRAETMLHVDLNEDAGRAAYLAGFHAAQALIFEREGRMLRTHKGVQGEFARLMKDDDRFDIDLRAFLGQAYNLKAIADYETGFGSAVSVAQANEAITVAKKFVAHLAELLEECPPA